MGAWDRPSPIEGHKKWMEDLFVADHGALPSVVSWGIGILGNAIFFKRNPSPGLNLYKIKYLYDDIKMVPRAKSPRQIGSNGIGKTNPYSYLDGASQGKFWTMSC